MFTISTDKCNTHRVRIVARLREQRYGNCHSYYAKQYRRTITNLLNKSRFIPVPVLITWLTAEVLNVCVLSEAELWELTNGILIWKTAIRNKAHPTNVATVKWIPTTQFKMVLLFIIILQTIINTGSKALLEKISVILLLYNLLTV